MADEYSVSLTYPNPSLGGMASLEEPERSHRSSLRLRTSQDPLDRRVTGARQVVLIIS